jgi:hypothetical protein
VPVSAATVALLYVVTVSYCCCWASELTTLQCLAYVVTTDTTELRQRPGVTGLTGRPLPEPDLTDLTVLTDH